MKRLFGILLWCVVAVSANASSFSWSNGNVTVTWDEANSQWVFGGTLTSGSEYMHLNAAGNPDGATRTQGSLHVWVKGPSFNEQGSWLKVAEGTSPNTPSSSSPIILNWPADSSVSHIIYRAFTLSVWDGQPGGPIYTRTDSGFVEVGKGEPVFTGRNVTLSHTNSTGAEQTVGIGDGSGWIIQNAVVDPGATYTRTIHIEEGDTRTFAIYVIDTAAQFADGVADSTEDQSAWYFPGSAMVPGTAKGYADGTAGAPGDNPYVPTDPQAVSSGAPDPNAGDPYKTETDTPTAPAKDGTVVDGLNGLAKGIGDIVTQTKLINTKLTTGNAHLLTIKEKTSAMKDSLTAIAERDKARKDFETEMKALSENQARYNDKATAMKAQGASIVNAMAAGMGSSSPVFASGSNSAFAIAMPGGLSVNLDPASDAGMTSVATFIKVLLEWILAGCYGWWCWGEINKMMVNLMIIPQARGNTVAGTGGQITAFLSATIITVLIYSAVPIIWAAADTGAINTSGFWSRASAVSGAVTGPVSAGIYLLRFFIPVDFILALVVQSFIFRKTGTSVCLGVYAAIKHIVP